MSNDLIPMNDLERMATAVAGSKLFGVKTPNEAMAIMLVAQAENMHPMTAVMEFDIIQGRPARKSWAMLSRFQQSGGKVEWHERTDTKVKATFSHPQGGTVTVDWDMERAKKAGLASKDMWGKYPRNMLTARVISEGVRTVFPGATGGFYTPEEARDMVDVTPPKAPAKTPAAPEKTPDPVVDVEDDAPDYVMHWPSASDSRDTWKAAAKRALQVIRELKDPKSIYIWQEQNIDGLRLLKAAASDLHDELVDKMTSHVNSLVPAEGLEG